jgi:hypothetical protein
VDHPAVADVGNGIGDTASDRDDRDGGDCKSNAVKARVHCSPSSLVPGALDTAEFEGLTEVSIGRADSHV